jgi:hypothetical protein
MLTKQSFDGQDAIEPGQSPLRSEDSRRPLPTTGINNGTPRDFTLDFGEDAMESAQSAPGHYASEDVGLPSPTAGIDYGTPRDFTLDFGGDGRRSSPQPPSVVWAGKTEYNPPGIAIEAWNEMIHDQSYCSTAPATPYNADIPGEQAYTSLSSQVIPQEENPGGIIIQTTDQAFLTSLLVYLLIRA